MNAPNRISAPSAPSLTPARRSQLRARAQGLSPVVGIAGKGLTAAVLREIDRCLTAHELIKIRVFEADRDARNAYLAEVCGALGAAPVQHIGKLLVVWRPKPATPPTSEPPPGLTKKAAAARIERRAGPRRLVKNKR